MTEWCVGYFTILSLFIQLQFIGIIVPIKIPSAVSVTRPPAKYWENCVSQTRVFLVVFSSLKN